MKDRYINFFNHWLNMDSTLIYTPSSKTNSCLNLDQIIGAVNFLVVIWGSRDTSRIMADNFGFQVSSMKKFMSHQSFNLLV